MKIAVIPARSGSKRIPGKNTKKFYGKPILSWPIAAALESGLFDQVIVSTDCRQIAKVAEAAGATVPFIRPTELAGDFVATVPVIQHAIAQLANPVISHVCCIYPTAVFLTPEILAEAVARQQQLQADFVMPVTAFPCPVERALIIAKDGTLAMRHPEHLNTRTQDCASLYHDVGQFYYGTTQAWLSNTDFYQQKVAAVSLPKYRAHDIDNPDDWVFAELVFSQLTKLTSEYD
ncbi:pseudaminic acid cytidylyltransferase [Arsukibacterium sp.]|uniref:pseudaminic acid cytidylyltransferase n=1 Tax=Arsukibacterium sp. TaxID=1977258 RepID=UPI00299F33D6|nr:pseudaminic acid cytidylyltransferase [Arsukibacterium sp.]MDX1677260.1 pseudaminic acid cytidylyltransferase [Arsukibacterium sp.]